MELVNDTLPQLQANCTQIGKWLQEHGVAATAAAGTLP